MTPSSPHIIQLRCPVDGCTWIHDEPAMDIPDGATEKDLADLSKLYNAQIEDLLREHYSSHQLPDWLRTVTRLQQQLAATKPLACVGCMVERDAAQRAGQLLPALNVAQGVANGQSFCLEHVQVSSGPVLNDRSAGGIVLPGGGISPRANGSGN